MISGSFVVLLIRIPLQLNAPNQYCTTPPARSPRMVAPGLRYAVAAEGYKSDANDRSTKSRLGALVRTSCAKGSIYCPTWKTKAGLGLMLTYRSRREMPLLAAESMSTA